MPTLTLSSAHTLIEELIRQYPNVPRPTLEDYLWAGFNRLVMSHPNPPLPLMRTTFKRAAIDAWRAYQRECEHLGFSITGEVGGDHESDFEAKTLPLEVEMESKLMLDYLRERLNPEEAELLDYYFDNGDVADKQVSRDLYGQATAGQKFRRIKSTLTSKVRRHFLQDA